MVARRHLHSKGTPPYVVNLDPAAEHFAYPVAADIRELISLEDVMEAQQEIEKLRERRAAKKREEHEARER